MRTKIFLVTLLVTIVLVQLNSVSVFATTNPPDFPCLVPMVKSCEELGDEPIYCGDFRCFESVLPSGKATYYCSGGDLLEEDVENMGIVRMETAPVGWNGWTSWSDGALVVCTRKVSCLCSREQFLAGSACNHWAPDGHIDPHQAFNDQWPDGGLCVGQ